MSGGVSVYPPTGVGRLIGKSGIATSLTYPAAPATVSVNRGTASFGSWVQLTASTSSELVAVGFGVAADVSPANAAGVVHLQLGVGGSGSEAAVAVAVGGLGSVDSDGAFLAFGVPPRIASGSRLSVQASTSLGGAPSLILALLYVPFAAIEGS